MRALARIAVAAAGAALASGIGALATQTTGMAMLAEMNSAALAALGPAARGAGGVRVSFVDPQGYPSRRPQLSGGAHLADAERARLAKAVAALPGVAGVWWQPRGAHAHVTAAAAGAACRSNVDAVLAARSIRFDENSARLLADSARTLDEVAAALRPCAGSVVAITGHTDARGTEAQNVALSQARALAVRDALARRGIDMAGLRAQGLGSARPLAGLDPADPANRRIEFDVVAPVSPEPTVVDTPGAD